MRHGPMAVVSQGDSKGPDDDEHERLHRGRLEKYNHSPELRLTELSHPSRQHLRTRENLAYATTGSVVQLVVAGESSFRTHEFGILANML
jgi:hypothetical protein